MYVFLGCFKDKSDQIADTLSKKDLIAGAVFIHLLYHPVPTPASSYFSLTCNSLPCILQSISWCSVYFEASKSFLSQGQFDLLPMCPAARSLLSAYFISLTHEIVTGGSDCG